MSASESLPIIFLILLIGFVCQQKKLFTQVQIDGFALFLYKIGTPCFLFSSIVRQDFSKLFNTGYISSYILTFLIMAVGITFIYKKQEKQEICIKILASSYANTSIYIIPATALILGDPSAGIMSNILQVIVIQTIFIIILNLFYHKEKYILRKLFQIISTPLVMIPILAVVLNIFQMNPHPVMLSVIQKLGVGTPALGLFTFGLTLGSIDLKNTRFTKEVLWIVLFKNAIHPLIGFIVGKYIFELNGYWLYSLIIATSAPTAFVVYILGQQFSKNPHWIKTVLALTSIISTLSLIMISLMKDILG